MAASSSHRPVDVALTALDAHNGDDTYSKHVRAWMKQLPSDLAAEPPRHRPPAYDRRKGSDELKHLRHELHEAAKQHWQILTDAWHAGDKQRRADYDAKRDWRFVRQQTRFNKEDAQLRLWIEERERRRQQDPPTLEEIHAQALAQNVTARAAEKATAKWQELCRLLPPCGLERLANEGVRHRLLAHAIVPELHGPSQGLGPFVEFAPKQHVICTSVLCALTAYLNKMDSFTMIDGSFIVRGRAVPVSLALM